MISYSCGCKFKTECFLEAVKHAVEYDHVVTAHGLVRPEEHWEETQKWNGNSDK